MYSLNGQDELVIGLPSCYVLSIHHAKAFICIPVSIKNYKKYSKAMRPLLPRLTSHPFSFHYVGATGVLARPYSQ